MKKLFQTTEKWSAWWKGRKIDWNEHYLQTFDHPHRKVIVAVLKTLNFVSLFEIGCGPGANLLKIIKEIQDKQVGGTDINADAIELAKKTFNGGVFKVGRADDIMLSDDSTDVALSDMVYIYISPRHIDRHIRELKRITRNYVVLCEFHSISWWQRFKLKWQRGYFAHNWKKLLEKHGFYDVCMIKLRPQDWDGEPQKTFAYVIMAKVPTYKN
ncbi:MAG: class I SAM-dependent methyltransferase [Patescibacteria group bacterium]